MTDTPPVPPETTAPATQTTPPNSPPPHVPPPHATMSGDPLMPAKIVYGLYAIGYIVGITHLAGVIYAYLSRGKDAVLDTHLRFQIRTFWIGLAIAVVGFVLLFVGIGILVYLALVVWGLVRIISGFLLANEGKPISGSKYLGFMAI